MVRAAWQTLATTAGVEAAIGAPLTIPRGKETLLQRAMVRHALSDHPEIVRDPSQPLAGDALVLLAARAAWFAETFHDHPGPRRNLALGQFVARVTLAIEARLGVGAATIGWDDSQYRPEQGLLDAGLGLLYRVVATLQPYLPDLADAKPRALYDAILAARKRGA
jgi:hypothetical protein